MSRLINLSLKRRRFLELGAAAGALVLGFTLPGVSRARAQEEDASGRVNAFLTIGPDGSVTIFSPFIEMGQGTYTSIPMLIAEELDIEMSAVRVEQAPHGPEYRIMFGGSARFTGGSLSVRSGFEPLRQAGATARAMLIAAAAEEWGVAPGSLSTEPGFVVHAASGRRLPYGQLAPRAAAQEPPRDVPLKDPASFRLLGKPTPRTDSADKSAGRALFGIDFQAPGLLVAAVGQSPVFGGAAADIDASVAVAMPGVTAVDEIPNGIAVLADNYWHAKNALAAVKARFADAPHPGFSSEGYLRKLRSRLDDEGVAAENEGDVVAAFGSAAKVIEADYHAPFLAHATMEPMTCAALVENASCKLWAPNQGADLVAQTAASVTGLPLKAIEVQTPFLGGGFGRRFITDFVAQAATLAAKHPGRPVKVIWSREEDMQHDYYRPMTAARYRGAFDANGRLVALHITNVGDGPQRRHSSEPMAPSELDESVVEGARHQPYAIPNRRCNYVFEYSPAPIGYWRSVGNSHNAFFKESFMDELAHAAGSDPVAFRRSLLAKEPRFLKVLDTAAAMAGWRGGKWRATDGREHAMGVALHKSFGSIVAQVAEVSLNGARKPAVHKVWCAVDCGFAVNPLVLVHQIESGVAYGLSAALREEITIEEGRVSNGNFDTYPILTAAEMADVEVEIINGGKPMGGIGEVGTPPIAPAVCNALFTLTGKRIRSLPLSGQSFAA